MSLKKLESWLWRSRRKIGVWGYFVETTVYGRALFRRQMPETRFLIFAQGRTGSELLCDLLDSHSQIHCDREILNQPVLIPHRLIRCSALLSKCDTYGFKVKIYQLTQRQNVRDVKAFLTRLHEEGWRIIYLSRRNLLRHALSDVVRIKSRKAHRYRTKDDDQPTIEKVRVDCDLLREQMETREAFLAEEEKVLADLPCCRVVYDDDLFTGEWNQTLKRIYAWLGLAYEPPTTNLARNTPPRIVDFVENYDEVVSSLSNTKFSVFLEESSS